LASPDGPVGQWEGVVEGLIIDTPTGEDGFGYDPVFYYPPAAMTFAQMSREQKSLVSHRGKALREFRRAFPHLDLNSTAS
jgi:XTP/dITP diphosphohydrolase